MEKLALILATVLNNSLDNIYPVNKLRYGIELFLSQLTLITSILILSIITDTVLEMLHFMIPLFLIRTCSGGYHSKSFSQCFFITNSVCFSSIYLSQNIHNTLFYTIITFFSCAVICFFSPITNRMLSQKAKQANKMFACFFTLFFTFLVFSNITEGSYITPIFAFVLLAVAISMLLSVISKQKQQS